MNTQNAGDVLLRSLRKAGPLPAGKSVVGRVLSSASRSLIQSNSQLVASQLSQASTQVAGAKSGKAASKGKLSQNKGGNGKKGGRKGNHSETVLEIYMVGGISSADVMLFEAWDEEVRTRLAPLAVVGSVVRISNCLVVPHSDKTKFYSTSRAPVYLKALPETTIVVLPILGDFVKYLTYHPVTPFPSIVRLEPKTLMNVAGRVISPAPYIETVSFGDGEAEVRVTHMMLRADNHIIRISFWRETASMTDTELVYEGALVMINGVAKQSPGKDMDPRRHAGLRAVSRTAILQCPTPLLQILESTPATADGAVLLTPVISQRKDYSTVKSQWMSLSVLNALLKAGQVRDIQAVFNVPSVHIELESLPTYMACSNCSKAWNEPAWPPCACGAERKLRWRAKLVLKDGTASLNATCFDSFEEVVAIAAAEEGLEPRQSGVVPEEFVDEAVVAKAMSYVGAVPLTVLVTVDSDAWKGSMQATVQLVQKTHTSAGVAHPMKALVHLAPTEGACPPCELSQTTYDEALGLTVVGDFALHCWRAFVKVCDAPKEDTLDECTREMTCVFGTGEKYLITVQDDAAGMRLRSVTNGAHIHAVLFRESSDRLAVTSFVVVPEPIENFKKFFAHEVQLQKDVAQTGPSFKHGNDDTPRRIVSAAEEANLMSPPAWKVRKTFEH
jgi:hypothetical protein